MGSARAGYYTVSYSGGGFTKVGRYGTQTSPYTLNTNTSEYGVPYANAQWGVDSGTAYSASVTCGGEITATFTYHPGTESSSGSGGGYGTYGGGSTVSLADDPPPSVAVIAETCTASWGGSDRIIEGSANNTLGFEEVVDGGNSQSSGTRYKIQENPGTSFTVKCSPQAKVSGTGVVGPPDINGSGNAFVKYKAKASALEVILSGGIGPNHDKQFLIGQKVGATLSTGGLTADAYNWSIGGGDPFKNWTASYSTQPPQSQGQFTQIGAETNSTLSFYFKKPDDINPATVSCAIHLVVPTGSLPTAGLNVTPSRECTVRKPNFTFSVSLGYVHLTPTGSVSPDGIKLGGLPSPTGTTYPNDMGITYSAQVTTPSDFMSAMNAIGGWNFVQLVKPGRHHVLHSVAQGMAKNDLLCVDNTYPYEPAPYASHPGGAGQYSANGTVNTAADAPSNGLPADPWDGDGVNYFDSFGTWLMYLPPGNDSRYVPLGKIWWYWHGTADYDSSRASKWSHVTGSVVPDSDWGLDGPEYPHHPEWEELLLNTDLVNYIDE